MKPLQLGRWYSSDDATLGLWDMDEGGGTNVDDHDGSEGTDDDATLQNGAGWGSGTNDLGIQEGDGEFRESPV